MAVIHVKCSIHRTQPRVLAFTRDTRQSEIDTRSLNCGVGRMAFELAAVKGGRL